MRTLRVQGLGTVTQFPDLIVVNLSLTSENPDYDFVLEDITNRTEILRRDIEKAGFSRDDLKTVDFRVEMLYQYDNGKQIFAGFRAVHALKLDFSYNQEVLNRLLKMLAQSSSRAGFQVAFEVADKTGFQNQALAFAVKNARMRADVIAESASIKLGRIMNINYSDRPLKYAASSRLDNIMLKTSSLEITPDEVKDEVEVLVEWEIADNL